MAERKQRRIKNFSGCWTEPDLTALAVWYITSSGHCDVRSGIGAALGAVFGPLAVAIRSESVEEVEKAIALSRSTYEAFLFNARAYVGSAGPATGHGSVAVDRDISIHQQDLGTDVSDLEANELPIPMEDD